ncbi:homoserine kinase [Helicobacter sp. CLO-3]|uniref:homoserine kinase n=1 Tax=unclassified Helicobacter TaxID=2593540 RepID=UPI000805D1A6|nr:MULTISPECIES: homoserine kinase [unclassified Helicobacter]OBV29972.1 homoserine kinase [Helicobacter sp. CLO-3]OHU83208.1 homoserine kinase [Helicobacter sp. CLO-3]
MIISVPATSANLGPGLDVLGLSLDFRNEFSITKANATSIEIYGEGEGVERFIIDNMFVKIFRKTLGELGGDAKQHFRFVFSNQIPVSRGMGSSSAVIVGAIAAAYKVAGLKIDRESILERALKHEPHPDNITPATFGGFNVAMLGTGTDSGKVFHLRHDMPSYLRAVMVIPDRSISTKYSRQTLPKKYASHDVVFNMSRTSMLAMAIMQEKWDLLALASQDRMHQDRRMRQYPILFSVQKCALENGALMSTLSGSGSSFFNLCFDKDMSHLLQTLQKKFYRFRVVPMRLDNEGLMMLDERV